MLAFYLNYHGIEVELKLKNGEALLLEGGKDKIDQEGVLTSQGRVPFSEIQEAEVYVV